MNLSTFTNISSTTSLGCGTDRSIEWIIILVGVSSPKLNFMKILQGMTQILASKTANVLSSIESPITHGIMKLLKSFNFLGNLFWRIAEHSLLNVAIATSPSFLLLVSRSFKNLAYFGICANASTKGRLICNCLNNSRILLNWSFVSPFFNREGYGILVDTPSQ